MIVLIYATNKTMYFCILFQSCVKTKHLEVTKYLLDDKTIEVTSDKMTGGLVLKTALFLRQDQNLIGCFACIVNKITKTL